MVNTIVLVIMLFIGVVGWGILLCKSVSRKNRTRTILSAFCMVTCVVMLMVASIVLGREMVYRDLARGVEPEQLPVKGEYRSTAQVEIIHRDGELENVILAKGTTIPKK